LNSHFKPKKLPISAISAICAIEKSIVALLFHMTRVRLSFWGQIAAKESRGYPLIRNALNPTPLLISEHFSYFIKNLILLAYHKIKTKAVNRELDEYVRKKKIEKNNGSRQIAI